MNKDNQNFICRQEWKEINCMNKEISDIIKYKIDKEKYLYDKLCLIKIDNADLLLSYIGAENYNSHFSKELKQLFGYLNNHKISEIIKVYRIDWNTVILVNKPETSEEEFMEIIHRIHKEFRYKISSELKLPILARFAIVLNEINMLNIAISELKDMKNAQKHLVITKNSDYLPSNTISEFKMINIIHWAIENDGVIPHYQGIYDTHEKCVDKYESLMRIVDENNVVYYPNEFMDIAKKYRMYSQLSEIMIKKVLKDVEKFNFEVTINISAFDINSSDFKNELFKLLNNRKSKSLLVFEILEDELFLENSMLQEFIKEIEKFGVKVAIDDFGSGYSNWLDIAKISPHFIKINGEIIKKLNDSYQNKMVLESIIYLAEKIGAYTVAEHVENIEIVNSLKEYKIDLLQGFYYSKPVPIKNIVFDKTT